MDKLEQRLKAAGAVLVRKGGKHKLYELAGRRFTLSYGAKGKAEKHDYMKPVKHLLEKLEQKKK